MTQRVTVQFSVPLDELEPEILRLYDDCKRQLHEVATLHDEDIYNNALSLSSIEKIDQLRIQMAKVDIRLSEIATLMSGYVSYMSEQLNEISPEPVAEVRSDVTEISELQSKLTNFKNVISKVEEEVANAD